MFKWWFEWWRKKLFGNAVIVETTSKDGQMLTDYENEKLRKSKMRECPDCDGPLRPGPEGGGQNFACSRCGSEFNLEPFLMFSERISDRGPRELGDREKLYRPVNA